MPVRVRRALKPPEAELNPPAKQSPWHPQAVSRKALAGFQGRGFFGFRV